MNNNYIYHLRVYGRLLSMILIVLTLLQLSPTQAQISVDAVDDHIALLNNQEHFSGAPGLLANDTPGTWVTNFDSATSIGNAVQVNADGSWSVASANGYVGSVTFNYAISDGASQDTATVTLYYESPPRRHRSRNQTSMLPMITILSCSMIGFTISVRRVC